MFIIFLHYCTQRQLLCKNWCCSSQQKYLTVLQQSASRTNITVEFRAPHNSSAYLLYSDSKMCPKSAKCSKGCGTELLRHFSSRQMRRDVLLTNKHCLQLPVQDWTSSQHVSKVNPCANITKIDCVQKCNLYSFAMEAERVTLECVRHHLAF